MPYFLKNNLLIYIFVNSLFQGLFKCYLCYWDAPALILLLNYSQSISAMGV